MKISNETKVGALTIIALAILILGYNFLKGNDLFTKKKTIYAVYDRVDGLVPSSRIVVNGLSVGRVATLELAGKGSGNILATFIIHDYVDIPKNSLAKLVSSDLLGTKEISLELGDAKEFLKSEDTIQAAVELSLAKAVEKQIAPVKIKAERLLDKIDTVLLTIGYVFNEKNIKNIDESLNNIQVTIRNFRNTTSRFDTLVQDGAGRIDKIIANINHITLELKESKFAEKLSAITDSIQQSGIKQSINDAQKAMDQVVLITEKINRGEGSLGLLLKDKKLYNNLSDASEILTKILIDFKRKPRRYFPALISFGSKADKEYKVQERQDSLLND